MTSPRDRRKKLWRNDPWVWISPPWLRALMEAGGLTVAKLAERTGNSDQTIANLTKGNRPKRTRASRRRKLARALGAAEDRLAGTAAWVIRRGARVGYEERYSARTTLAAERVVLSAITATQRDIARITPPMSVAEAAFVEEDVTQALLNVMRIGDWRARLLAWKPSRDIQHGYTEPRPAMAGQPAWGPPADDPAHETATLALILMLDHVLQPWFDGDTRLDYATLRTMGDTLLPLHTEDRLDPRAILHDQITSPPLLDPAGGTTP